ncbi:MAG: 3-phosphoshikimate 1-carboxyvinyltransferase [Chloroflexi bacterium]|nr:MAG: 3-phosphoshikimate 1-carboxyvinyltransferase [Chloroflexota bacterium]
MTVSTPGSAARALSPARAVRGIVRVPGDKSISHRAALFNALGDGQASITNFSPGADCASTLNCLRDLGVDIERNGDRVSVRGSCLRGLREPSDVLDCGNSGTSMRLLSGALAGSGVFAVLSGDGSLRRRPMARVVEPLRQAGARIDGREGGRLPPLVIFPVARLRGIEHRPRVASAQVKSALLLAALFAEADTTVVEPALTRDHTERLLRAMGAELEISELAITLRPVERLRCVDVEVPGDFSSAAFWLTLGVLHPAAEIRIQNVGLNPTRTGFLTILQRMGANVELQSERDVAGEPVADLVAWSSKLRATTVGADLVPLAIDEIPLVALLGLFADGETVVSGAGELGAKESDRLAVVAEGLSALGGQVEATADGWRITPSHLEGGRVDSANDHRMAMLFALAGVLGKGAEIAGAESVSISYPSFWADLERLTTPDS